MDNKSSLQLADEQAAAVQKTPNRVTYDDMQEAIETVEYLYPESAPLLTIAVIKLKNGFCVTGESAAADPENHNQELGQKFARESAERKIWPLLGFALREKLAA